MVAGGESGNGIRTDFHSGRDFRLQFHGMGARACLLERSGGLVRDVRLQLAAGDCFPSRAISNEV